MAIDLTAKGFGFALLDVRRGLLDWGFCSVKAADDSAFLARIVGKIERGRPTALVVENIAVATGRETAHRRHGIILRLATERRLGMCHVSREVVRRVFGVSTKTEIAGALARRFPELQPRLPPERSRWASEDERMHIFDALSFAAAIISPVNRPGAS